MRLKLIGALSTVLLSVTVTYAQQWSSVLDSSRAIDWSQAGVTAGIPNRTTICSTLNPGATAAQINSAIASCASGQTVSLAAGTYNLTAGITFANKNNVTLRGAGPNSTFLVFAGNDACGGKAAAMCIPGSYLDDSPTANHADWTSGYTRGTTSITIDSITGTKPTAGTILILDQLSDDPTDTGDVWVCNTTPTCAQGGGNTGGAQSYLQQQIVTIVSISSGACPCTVVISSPIYMPNWRSSKSPRAWWTGCCGSVTIPASGVGIEDLSVDSSASGSQWGISFFLATHSWLKNIREIRKGSDSNPGSNKQVLLFLSTHITVRDSYFFGRLGYDDYGINCYWCSDNLIENNILQHIPLPMHNEKGQGNVWAYNYAINNLWSLAGTWAQGSNAYHAPGSSYELHEGNDGHGLAEENYFGQVHFITAYRNRFTGQQASETDQTVPIFIYAQSRYSNIIGNVLGLAGYHTKYETLAGASTTDCPSSVFVIGLGGNCANGGAPTYPDNDTLTTNSLMRWGNYDVVNAANRFVNAEVPSGLSIYGNPVPGNQTLPPSFYLSSKPVWFGLTPWPAIGPDVNGGDVSNVGGRAYRIPARKCFEDVMGGTFGDTAALTYNANMCYAVASGSRSSGPITRAGPISIK